MDKLLQCEICSDPAVCVDVHIDDDGTRVCHAYCETHSFKARNDRVNYCVRLEDVARLEKRLQEIVAGGAMPSVTAMRACFPLFDAEGYLGESGSRERQIAFLNHTLVSLRRFLEMIS